MVAQALRDAGYAAVVIGSQAERTIAAAIREVCPQVIDLCGQTALDEVAALAQRAMLAIGNDTGVTHLAAAAGCPVVVLFSGATDPDWCAPRGRWVRILAARDIADLRLDQVLAEIRAILVECTAPARSGMPQPPPEAAIASGARD
jgi:ADP-heptose:LPS heptosyltransferase